MRKEEFLTALRAGLTGLLPEGVEKLVEFCSEMIDDRMEDGLTEEEAVAAAGSLDELIQQAKTELLPVKTANFTEKSTFGDTLRTYTAESSICDVAADCGPADFILLPSENNTCRVECAENETVHYVVTTENSVLHIRRADSRTVFSFFKFYRALRSEPVRVYLPQGAYKSLEVKVTSGDIAVPAATPSIRLPCTARAATSPAVQNAARFLHKPQAETSPSKTLRAAHCRSAPQAALSPCSISKMKVAAL